MTRASAPLFAALTLDRDRQDMPLHRQLYAELRGAILSRRLPPGTRLPATRVLSRELGISRNTALEAYEQLLAEGYLTGRVGAGTFVDPGIAIPAGLPTGPVRPLRFSRLSRAVSALQSGIAPRLPLAPGVPCFDHLPLATWARLMARRIRDASARQLNYGEPLGDPRLRRAIAGQLAASRGVRCDPDQVALVDGAQQGIDLAVRLLLDAGDEAWIEDPGYLGTAAVLTAAGARLVPVPVDDSGLVVEAGIRRAVRARLAYVTPSHQYPTGVTLTLPRRLELLAWARKRSAYVLEDDYDSEFRFGGRSLPALQGLDTGDRVVYLGTFSKVLFASLRCAYLVVPRGLVEPLGRMKTTMDSAASLLDHAALADFIEQGHFGRHIRKMRAIYARRRDAFGKALAERFGSTLAVSALSGLHAVLWLPTQADDKAVAARLHEAGFGVAPLSAFCLRRAMPPGLVVGYGNATPTQVSAAMDAIAAALGVS